MGIFANSGLYAIYEAEIQFRQRVMGGIPADPKVIEAWIRARSGIIDQGDEVRIMMIRTLRERHGQLIEQGKAPELAEISDDATLEELIEISKKIGEERHTVGFKSDSRGLYLEDRQVKAWLKEVTNILFADERWGATGKGPKAFVAERVAVWPSRIHMFITPYTEEQYNHGDIAEDDPIWGDLNVPLTPVTQPTGVHLMIGHVSGPQGQRSTLTYHQHVWRPRIKFQFKVARDSLSEDVWPQLWNLGEDIGLGAVRSQQFGSFDILKWEKVQEAGPVVKSGMQRAPKVSDKKDKKDKQGEEIKEEVVLNGHAEPEEVREAVVAGR